MVHTSFGDTTIVVPAFNEENYLPALLSDLGREAVGIPVIVVDNASTDRTAEIAAGAGACVLHCARQGKGAAVKTALAAVTTPNVFLCDADISGLNAAALAELAALKRSTGRPAARLSLNRSADGAPVTTLTALPILAALGIHCREPLGGLVLADTRWMRGLGLPDGWAIDIALTVLAHLEGAAVVELPVTGISHRLKQLSDYRDMAYEVAAYLVDHASARTR